MDSDKPGLVSELLGQGRQDNFMTCGARAARGQKRDDRQLNPSRGSSRDISGIGEIFCLRARSASSSRVRAGSF